MQILHSKLHKILDPWVPLTLTGEGILERILEDPTQPLQECADQGFGIEAEGIADNKKSLVELCRHGQQNGAKRMDVSYDFFFGGDHRENYPDSPLTVQTFKVIHDLAKEHGMGFAASVISPLDTGGEYVKTHPQGGQTMQFCEGVIAEDGHYHIQMDYQTQWTNNKGPAKLTLKQVKVFAFDEEPIENTPFYYVDENKIQDISVTAQYFVDPASLRVEKEGYGHGVIHISGRTDCKKQRFLAVVIYNTLEIDYFSPNALEYMKSIIDLHHKAGISYDGIYSDEMHIQFDWDMQNHWGLTEVTTRYMTDAMAQVYASLYGVQYRDFEKYLVYFTYMHHDFVPGEAEKPVQHVFGKSREDIWRTFQFRKRYFELLHGHVVDLCNQTKAYAESLFGHKLQATGHSTWQESPTCDSLDEKGKRKITTYEHNKYDYTPAFGWSAAQRENISACNDHFKWNDYFWAVGTDIPEGGFLDRNYFGAAITSGLSALNEADFAYYCIWGAPDQVKERLVEVAQTYGHYAGYCKSYDISHNLLQGCTGRLSDVLTLCPMDLNFVEERFGNWMSQYGYTDYITEQKLLEHVAWPDGPVLQVKNRKYRALVVTFSPMMSEKTLELIHEFLRCGGKVIWSSMPAMLEECRALFCRIFGIEKLDFGTYGQPDQNKTVHFNGLDLEDMQILTDLLPDYIYPVTPSTGQVIATLDGQTVGLLQHYPNGGRAVYLGFRVRDDQSCSTGSDVATLFRLLCHIGAYEKDSCEAMSRPAESRYIYNRFKNGAVSVANHFRTFREGDWERSFYRNEALDDAYMKNVSMPPHDISLDGVRICNHTISYRGEGLVTYRYDDAQGLLAFAGRNTTGITIDGKQYRFSEEPINISWGLLDDPIRDPSVNCAYVFRCDTPGKVTLPFAGEGFRCCVCRNYMLDCCGAYPYATCHGQVVIDITPSVAGQWLVFYK